MASFNLNLRNPIDPITEVRLIVRWKKNRLVLGTGEKIDPKHWNNTRSSTNRQRARSSYPGSKEFNARLSFIVNTAESVFRRFQNDNAGKEPSLEQFRHILQVALHIKEDKQEVKFWDALQQFITEGEGSIQVDSGKHRSAHTIRKYRLLKNALIEYSSHAKTSLHFNVIDQKFLQAFLGYLLDVKKLSPNTQGKYISTLKAFLNYSLEKEWHSNLQFKKFKPISVPTSKTILQKRDVEALNKLELELGSPHDKVRDLFIVGCFTGLRYSDLLRLSSEMISDKQLEIRATKTDKPTQIPLHPIAARKLAKYTDDTGKLSMPKYSSQAFNRLIKEVALKSPFAHELVQKTEFIGGKPHEVPIEKYLMISAHTARRTFATMSYLSGIPPKIIMAVTGHSTEKELENYIQIQNHEVHEEYKKFWSEEN